MNLLTYTIAAESKTFFKKIIVISCAIIALSIYVLGQGNTNPMDPKRGMATGASHSISDIENINLTNGNLMLNVPLASLPATSGGIQAGISLSYNSKLYEPSVEELLDISNQLKDQNILMPSPYGEWQFRGNQIYSLLVQIRPGQVPCEAEDLYYYRQAHRYKVSVQFPDGNKKEFRPVGHTDTYGDGYYNITPNGWKDWVSRSTIGEGSYSCSAGETLETSNQMVYYSTDGSFIRLVVDHDSNPSNKLGRFNSFTLYFPNGSSYQSSNKRTTDRYGEYVEGFTFTYNSKTAHGIQDSRGRMVFWTIGDQPNETYVYQKGFAGTEDLKWVIRYKSNYVRRDYRTTGAGHIMQRGGSSNQTGEFYWLKTIDEIELPEQFGDLKYEFDYWGSETPLGPTEYSDGWGEIKSVKLPSGAIAEYQYRHKYDTFPFGRPWTDHILEGSVKQKTLKYESTYDGINSLFEDIWTYEIGSDGSTVTSPDGSVMTQMHGHSEYEHPHSGLVYRIENSNGTKVEKFWDMNRPAFGGSQSQINPFVKAEFISVKNAAGIYTLTSIKEFTQDKNGNTTSIKEYDFIPYSSVPRNGYGGITGMPTGITPTRTTYTSYHNPAPDSSDTTTDHANAYWNFSNIKGVVASTEVRNSANGVVTKTEITYDNPSTTANPILTRTWDSAKGSLSTPLNDGNSVKSQATYNTYGMPLTTTDAKGTVTQITYGCIDGSGSCDDEYKNLYPTQTIAAHGTALARTSTATYDFFTGVVLTTTDVDNNITNGMIYDDVGRPVKSISALGTPLESWTTTEYNDELRRIIVRSDLETKGDGKKVAIQHFDQLGRVRLARTLENAATESPYNETHGIKVQSRYKASGVCTFDSNEDCTFQLTSNPYRANYSFNETDPTMGWTLSQNRNDGRYSEVQTFAGAALPSAFGGANSNSTGVVKSFSDANASTVEDQAGKKRRSITNALGQLIRVDEPNDAGELGTIASPNQPTSYAYDTLSNLTTVTQGVQARTFTYSSLSRLLTANNPESGLISYQYDPNGNLTKKIDARSIETDYTYDALNRVVSREYSDSTPDVEYTYKATAPAIGSLVKVESSVSTTEYTGFDILGRVTQHKQTTDGEEYDTEYVYNLSGGLVEQTYPSGRKVKNVTDQNGYLSMVQSRKSVAHGYMNYAQNFTYNAVGAVTSMQLGNGKWESTQFNSRMQPTQIGLGATQGATNFLKLDYSYGTTANNGNVQSQTITIPTVGITPGFTAVQNYTYDSLNRITTAEETIASSQTWKEAFIYDRYGNRNFDEEETTTLLKNCTESSLPIVCAADRKVFNPTANPSDNRLSSADDYVFDNSGNTTGDAQGRTFIFDAENKQVEVKDDLNLTVGKYWYDGDGKRIKKYVPATGETTVFVYDAAGRLIADYSTELAPDPKISYTTADHLGSPRILTDENGEIISRRDFHPFGEEIATTERTAPLGYQVDDVRQKFTTYERDTETDLDFAQARMHSYDLGRFTSPDPLMASAQQSVPQTYNRYIYVMNNPLRYIDPSGMIAGDFYNLDGNKIGTDGVDDKKIHIVYDEKKAKEIKKTKGNYKGTVDGKITLPGVNIVTAINEAVDRSDAATFDKSGFTLKKNQEQNGGGFREAGITWDKDGKVTVEPDGPYADPRIENAGMTITPDTEGSAHVHPSGVITTTTRGILTDAAGNTGPGTQRLASGIDNIVSPADYENAARGANIMIGGTRENRTATFYNKNGNLAQMSYKNFKKLGAKRK